MIVSIQASADQPSLVRPHWRNALGGAVNRFTGGAQIRHFVMAITVAVRVQQTREVALTAFAKSCDGGSAVVNGPLIAPECNALTGRALLRPHDHSDHGKLLAGPPPPRRAWRWMRARVGRSHESLDATRAVVRLDRRCRRCDYGSGGGDRRLHGELVGFSLTLLFPCSAGE
jgi:hypothetical protein